MRQALIVIDVQNSFRARPYWSDGVEVEAFKRNQQSVIDDACRAGVPVVQIFHTSQAEGPQGPFSIDSGKVSTLEGMRIAPDAVFRKQVHSSLFAIDENGRTLEQWLRANTIDEVLITGIRTEQCCETTARHASDSGFRVRFVSDATLTFPMQHASGRVYSAREIQERTELVLAGRFARIVDSAAAFA